MNRKQFAILIVLVAILGGAGLFMLNKRSASWTGGGAGVGQKLLGEFQVNDVAQIFMRHGTNELNLARKDDAWRVRERGDYPANFSEISGLLLKLRDLKVVQSEQVGPLQLPRLKLAAPGPDTNTATLLELRDSSAKAIKSLLLGKQHMQKSSRPMDDSGFAGTPDGRYVKVGQDSSEVQLISDPLSNVEPKPEEWLNKDFFKVEKPRSIAVTFAEATNSWKLTKGTESGEWTLADAKADEKLDSSKTSSFSYALSSPSFNDVVMDANPEQAGLDKPTVIALETFDGFIYTIKVGSELDANRYLTVTASANLKKERTPGTDEKPEDKAKFDKEFADAQKKLEEKLAHEKTFERWTFLVSNWTVDSLLKPRHELLAEKKDEPASGTETNAVELPIADPAP